MNNNPYVNIPAGYSNATLPAVGLPASLHNEKPPKAILSGEEKGEPLDVVDTKIEGLVSFTEIINSGLNIREMLRLALREDDPLIFRVITVSDDRYAKPAIEKKNREEYGEDALFSVYPVQVNRVPQEEITFFYNKISGGLRSFGTFAYLPVYYITGDISAGTGRYATIVRRASIRELHCDIEDLRHFFPSLSYFSEFSFSKGSGQNEASGGEEPTKAKEKEAGTTDNHLALILDETYSNHSPELALAIRTWLSVFGDPKNTPRRTTKKNLEEKARELAPKNPKGEPIPSKTTLERISTVINPNKTGGAPQTP